MYVYLGGDAVLDDNSIVGIFDLDNASWSHITRKYLARAEQRGQVKNAAEDIPRSFAVCTDKNVILLQPGTKTLVKRLDDQEKIYG